MKLISAFLAKEIDSAEYLISVRAFQFGSGFIEPWCSLDNRQVFQPVCVNLVVSSAVGVINQL